MRASFLVIYIRDGGDFNTGYEVSGMTEAGGFVAAGCLVDTGRGRRGRGRGSCRRLGMRREESSLDQHFG